MSAVDNNYDDDYDDNNENIKKTTVKFSKISIRASDEDSIIENCRECFFKVVFLYFSFL